MSAKRMMESTSTKLMYLILITCLLNNALTFLGEVAFSSLLVAEWSGAKKGIVKVGWYEVA